QPHCSAHSITKCRSLKTRKVRTSSELESARSNFTRRSPWSSSSLMRQYLPHQHGFDRAGPGGDDVLVTSERELVETLLAFGNRVLELRRHLLVGEHAHDLDGNAPRVGPGGVQPAWVRPHLIHDI